MERLETQQHRPTLRAGWADWAEVEAFRTEVERFARGELAPEEFKSIRLRHGVYGQRQPERYMVRVKVPAGRLTANQLEALGRLAEQFADGQAHVTTRQDLQLHYVRLEDIPSIMELLASVGLTTREACGNSVRNVTACPLAGLCRREEFDIFACAASTAQALLRNPRTQQLPRKFKIAFSGCAEDCALAAINDIGVIARTEKTNGHTQMGFRLLVGGGLGNWPQAAQALAEFVPTSELPTWIEAIVEVFNQYGNRRDRNRARLKFVIAEKGLDWFRDQVYARVRERGLPAPDGSSRTSVTAPKPEEARKPVTAFLLTAAGTDGFKEFPRWLESNVWPQRQEGSVAVWVTLAQGAIRAEQFSALARLARRYGDATLRTAHSQNLILPNVSLTNLRELYAELSRAGLALPGALEISDLTTCPGAETCNLGLTRSRSLAAELSRRLDAEHDPATRRIHIKISGCPNSCGQHHVADIGLHGLARKVDGQPAPFYQLLLGGGVGDGQCQFGRRIATLPARRVPEALARLLAFFRAERRTDESFQAFVNRKPLNDFRTLLEDIRQLDRADPELRKDWGQEEMYELKVGEGECAS